MAENFTLSGKIVDVVAGEIFKGKIYVNNGAIARIDRVDVAEDQFILPGLIDSHVHIESSMLVPAEFARLAVAHGTTATVSDPHEIANVLGISGIDFMIENGNLMPFKFFFGAPSCVPATSFESAGTCIDARQVESLLSRNDIWYLSEMMNFPGVIYNDPEVGKKLEAAHKLQKPIDGHAPGLDASQIKIYASAGITTDHECSTASEAIEKINNGMHILIREGSAARNFDALIPLIVSYPEKIMFCSDDKHPDDLVNGHINLLIKRSLANGYDVMDVLRACTLNPVKHYRLPCGLLQTGDPADMIVVDDLKKFSILKTFVNGQLVAQNGKCLLPSMQYTAPNHFILENVSASQLKVEPGVGKLQVIDAIDGELLTKRLLTDPSIDGGFVVSDTENDILKMAVINRYQKAEPAIGFIRGFGLKTGALASTVAHDSHNLICVGTNDEDMLLAINTLCEFKGGICVAVDGKADVLPLPVAGLMSAADGYTTARLYEEINAKAANLGDKLQAPFMTLSFMALLVIPELKLSDKGLFDGNSFSLTNLFTS